MPNHLTYFKFDPSEWLTGNITLCSFETQGIFINICNYYWKRECSICLANIKQRFFDNESNINELINNKIIKINDENDVIINFLDEQMNAFVDLSEKRAVAGQKGGKANAKQNKNIVKAKRSNLEKIREEKRREEKIYTENFLEALNGFRNMRKKIKKPMTERAEKMLLKKLNKLSNDESLQIKILNQSEFSSWQDIYELKQETKSKQDSNEPNKLVL